MIRGDGKNKFYKQLQIPKDVVTLIRYYNKIFKPTAFRAYNKTSDGSSGKNYNTK